MPTTPNSETQAYYAGPICRAIQETMDAAEVSRKQLARRSGVSDEAIRQMLDEYACPKTLAVIGRLMEITNNPAPLVRALCFLADRDELRLGTDQVAPTGDGHDLPTDSLDAFQAVSDLVDTLRRLAAGEDVTGDGKFDLDDIAAGWGKVARAQAELADLGERLTALERGLRNGENER